MVMAFDAVVFGVRTLGTACLAEEMLRLFQHCHDWGRKLQAGVSK